jgi:hypothetical protein
MKNIFIILCLSFSMVRAQDSTAAPVKCKVVLMFGMDFMHPDDINNHITISNDQLGSSAKTIAYMPEIGFMFSLRPLGDSQIITLRVGRMYITRMYDVSIPETSTSSTTVGHTSGTIKETYTMYPLSLGVGLASQSFGSQFQFEFIYAPGYIDEDQSYVSSSGKRTSNSRTLYSPAYGLRIAGSMTVNFSERIGLTLEAGYRYLVFNDYEDQRTGRNEKTNFNTSGLGGAIGLSILF